KPLVRNSSGSTGWLVVGSISATTVTTPPPESIRRSARVASAAGPMGWPATYTRPAATLPGSLAWPAARSTGPPARARPVCVSAGDWPGLGAAAPGGGAAGLAAPVHQARLDLAGDLRVAGHQVDGHAVAREDDVLLRHPGAPGQLGVGVQVLGLAVHRHDVLGAHDVVAVHELTGAGVPGDVHLGVALVDDVGAEIGELVDDPVDGVLVAGDQRAGHQHRVALADLDLVVAVGHARERRHRLALRAGADQRDLVIGHRLDLAEVDHQPLGDVQVAQIAGDLHVAHHRAAHEGDLAAVGVGGVEHLLDAVHVAGEAGDDDPPRRGGEHLIDRGVQVPLGHREARDLGVGGVGEEEVHTLLAQPGEGAQI